MSGQDAIATSLYTENDTLDQQHAVDVKLRKNGLTQA